MLMERILKRENLLAAIKRVERNNGSAGVDGMDAKSLRVHIVEHWEDLRSALLSGTYEPQPVLRVEIPKPDGGVRLLGIPTVTDRFIQQAIAQSLTGTYDPTFSEHSYGFRQGRSAHDAVRKAQNYIREGYRWVVDIDLEKFFDRANHDRLMSTLAKRAPNRNPKISIANKSKARFKDRVREITSRKMPYSLEYRVQKLNKFLNGWVNYYQLADTPSVFKDFENWIRRRLRMCIWKDWKKPRTRIRNLIRLGTPPWKAYEWGNTRKGYWRISKSPIMHRTLGNSFWSSQGLVSLMARYELLRHRS